MHYRTVRILEHSNSWALSEFGRHDIIPPWTARICRSRYKFPHEQQQLLDRLQSSRYPCSHIPNVENADHESIIRPRWRFDVLRQLYCLSACVLLRW